MLSIAFAVFNYVNLVYLSELSRGCLRVRSKSSCPGATVETSTRNKFIAFFFLSRNYLFLRMTAATETGPLSDNSLSNRSSGLLYRKWGIGDGAIVTSPLPRERTSKHETFCLDLIIYGSFAGMVFPVGSPFPRTSRRCFERSKKKCLFCLSFLGLRGADRGSGGRDNDEKQKATNYCFIFISMRT